MFIIVAEPVVVQAHNQHFFTSTAAATAPTAAPTLAPLGKGTKPITQSSSFFLVNFWAGDTSNLNATGFPGYDVTQGWQFDHSLYSPLNPGELNACPGVPTCNSFEDCCEATACAHRIIEDGSLAKVCVPNFRQKTTITKTVRIQISLVCSS